jgi:hypothetical protein
MAESTLSINKTNLDIIIAERLGYTRSSANWGAGTDELAHIDECRDKGTARFYNERQWNWLSPTTTITTTIDDYDQVLPDDFGSMRSDFYYAASQGYSPPTRTSVNAIREKITATDSSGVMEWYAINPTTQDGSAGLRWEVLWYPPPNAAYVMTYRYDVLRDALASGYPYPAGGGMHRNAIIEACLAAADAWLHEDNGHEAQYQMFLKQSIAIDGRNSPRFLGLSIDESDDVISEITPIQYCTLNGSVPS